MSASLVLISSVVAGCGLRADVSDEDDDRAASGPPEVCEADVRNDEWDIDCSTACNHVMACKRGASDSDLQTLSCGDCLGSCVAGVALGGNDLDESTEEDRTSWECASLVEGCHALDHNCDLF